MDCRREKSPNCPPSQPTRSPGLNIFKLTICAKHIPFIFFVQRISNETNLHKNELEKKRKRLKRKVWKRKINFRRKNFGNLDEWDPDPQMKKVENARMQPSCFDSFWEKLFFLSQKAVSPCKSSRSRIYCNCCFQIF